VARIGEERKVHKVLVGEPEGNRDHSEDQGIDGNVESEWILGRLTGGMDWIRLAQDRVWWRAVVNGGDEPSGSCAMMLFML
jgi:hypothetical protein